jgi:hypothetical protein
VADESELKPIRRLSFSLLVFEIITTFRSCPDRQDRNLDLARGF